MPPCQQQQQLSHSTEGIPGLPAVRCRDWHTNQGFPACLDPSWAKAEPHTWDRQCFAPEAPGRCDKAGPCHPTASQTPPGGVWMCPGIFPEPEHSYHHNPSAFSFPPFQIKEEHRSIPSPRHLPRPAGVLGCHHRADVPSGGSGPGFHGTTHAVLVLSLCPLPSHHCPKRFEVSWSPWAPCEPPAPPQPITIPVTPRPSRVPPSAN